jgi:site-specific recombinase XerD
MKRALGRSLSSSARTQYKASWRRFSKFTKNTLHASPLPSTPYTVALYVTHLAKLKLKSTTIRSYLSAIAFYHKIHGFDNPSTSFLINKLLLSQKKTEEPALERRPITISILRQLVAAMKSSGFSAYDRRLFRAIFTMMYHAALRASEICVTPHASHTLQRSHLEVVQCSGGDAIKICFPSYKHSEGRLCPILIHSSDKQTCAVRAYKSFVRMYHVADGPAFHCANNATLTRQVLANSIHTLLKAINLNPRHYNTHSFRIGKATDMAKQGFSYSQIAMLGRWKSNAFLKYIKPTVVHGTH